MNVLFIKYPKYDKMGRTINNVLKANKTYIYNTPEEYKERINNLSINNKKNENLVLLLGYSNYSNDNELEQVWVGRYFIEDYTYKLNISKAHSLNYGQINELIDLYTIVHKSNIKKYEDIEGVYLFQKSLPKMKLYSIIYKLDNYSIKNKKKEQYEIGNFAENDTTSISSYIQRIEADLHCVFRNIRTAIPEASGH